MTKSVVILGAGWAGLPLAHKLLKYTLPKLNGALKVTLVSPNSHFYWNIAATRGIIPDTIPEENLFLPIEPGFSKYPAGSFEFVLGKAIRVDFDAGIVTVQADGKQEASELKYDELVIATGSVLQGNLPLKCVGTHETTLEAVRKLKDQIAKANSVIVAGGGATGVEIAGEMAAQYGSQKEVTLLISGDRVLEASNALPSVSRTIENDLQKLGVKLVHNVRVVSSKEIPKAQDDNAPQTALQLSNGSSLTADLYMPCFGVKVNTSFIPASFLDDEGNLKLDSTMRVQGTKNAWGIGDVGNIESKQLTVTDAQINHLASTLDLVLTGSADKVKDYKPSDKTMIFVALGKKHATGQVGNWKLWGFIVAYVKGRSLFTDIAKPYVDGMRLRHASM